MISIYYTFVLPIHGGGKFILGGTYLPIYYLGMLFAKKKYSFKSVKENILVLLSSGILLLGWMFFIIKKGFYLDVKIFSEARINPPGITLAIYGILIVVFIFSLVSLLERKKIFDKVLSLFASVGKHSMYVFLYHLLVKNILDIFLAMDQNWIYRNATRLLMIFIPYIFVRIYFWSKAKIKSHAMQKERI